MGTTLSACRLADIQAIQLESWILYSEWQVEEMLLVPNI